MPYPWERPQLRPFPFEPFNSRVTYYAPGPGDRMEGGFETSQPNPQTGKRVPSTLDDVRLGTSPFVTLAGDPSRYGQTVKMGPLTYTSPIDRKSYTLPDVTGYVHDTGSAFRGRPDKLDVAAGDYRGYSPQAASAAVQADAGRRTLTPLSGDEADQAMRPIGLPEPWRATGAGENPTGPPPPSQGQATQGRKMPDSLLNMFQPTDPMGKPAGWNDAIAQRSNSLIGLGLGLLSPIQPGSGQTGLTQGLRGLMAGSQADTRNAEHRQQVARQAAQDAFQRSQAAQAQSNWEKTFGREPEVIRTMRAAGIDPASPEGRALMFPKTDEWKEGKVTHREIDYPYRANLRTGQYEWGPMGPPPGLNAARPTAPAATNPYAGGAAVPFVSGGGAPSAAGVVPSVAPSTTGIGGAAAAVPATTRSDYPPDFDSWLPSAQKAYEAERAKKLAQETVKSPQQEQTAKQQEQAAKQSASDVLTAIDKAEQQAVNKGGLLPTTGILGGKITQVYQPAADLEATLKTITGNVSLDKLTAMRAASPTGASGLGAVTESEHALLQASIAAVSQSQSQEQLLANLKRVRATYEWIVNRTDKNEPPPFSLRPAASQPATTGGTGGAGAAGGRTFIRDPSGKIVPQ